MPRETLDTVFARVFASGWAAPALTVIWHAGEPLVLPVQYYREAFDRIERARPRDLCLRHSIQTNGMLITPEWCDLFKQYSVGVGVSLDGPRHLHDAHRLTRSGRGTFDQTMRGVRLLRERGVPFHVITVLSERSLDDPDGLRGLLYRRSIDQVCFNVEESEGDHRSGLFAMADLRGASTTFSIASGGRRGRAAASTSFARSIRCCRASCVPRKRRWATARSHRSAC